MTDLRTLPEELLTRAREAPSGRAAESVLRQGPLRQTLMALPAGSELAEHHAPGPGSVQVLTGTVTFRFTGEDGAEVSRELTRGDLWPLVQSRHAVTAEEDAVFLLTVVVDE